MASAPPGSQKAAPASSACRRASALGDAARVTPGSDHSCAASLAL